MAQHKNPPEPNFKKARRAGSLLNALSYIAPTLAGKLAFKLFCTPRAGKIAEKDAHFLAEAKTSLFEIEDHFIKVYNWDPIISLAKEGTQAPSVLFVHGWESNSTRWHKYIKAFRKSGFRVTAFDAPAHGGSSGTLLNVPLYSRTLKGVMEKNGVPNVVVGHSIGGAAVVMSMAAFDAPRPEKAIILGTFAESTRVIQDFGKICGLRQLVLDRSNEHILKISGLPMTEYSVVKKAAQLHDVKGFVLHDLNDAVAPVEEGRKIAKAWEANYLETQGFGHRMQDKSVIEAVLAFAKI
jgi:predicted alpha/beta hydrolase family esterase